MRSEKSIPVTRAPRSQSFLDKYPVPQPASSTVRPLTSPANAQSTGSEFRMRLPSPSSPTCNRQSSATRFQRSRVSSYSSLLIDLSPAEREVTNADGNHRLQDDAPTSTFLPAEVTPPEILGDTLPRPSSTSTRLPATRAP